MNSKTKNDIKSAVAKYRNEFVYKPETRLPYCQWDLRDLVNSTAEKKNAKTVVGIESTWKEINDLASQKGFEALGLGLVIMKEQASNAVFKPSSSWKSGKYLFGTVVREIYYNPNPIISVIKKYERVYREKSINDRGRPVPGNRYFPTVEELRDKQFREKLFIYDTYLIAILDKDANGNYMLLHRIPFTFSPKKTSGIRFISELNSFQCQCSAFYENVAPFVFAMYLTQELTTYSDKNDETLSSQVMALTSVPISSQQEIDDRFVGESVGDVLQRWSTNYNSEYPSGLREDESSETPEEEPQTHHEESDSYDSDLDWEKDKLPKSSSIKSTQEPLNGHDQLLF